MSRSVYLAGVCMVTAVAAIAAGCATEPATPPSVSSSATPGQLASDPVVSTAYPSLVQVASRAVRLKYHSRYAPDGTSTTVSGVAFVPRGTPPAAGWPIVALAHPTTGIQQECAPSLYPNLLGSVGLVAALLGKGFATVLTDYQGLGSAGSHPYLEPTTAAYNVIDSVRAAHAAIKETATTWVGFGVSQGGQAVFRANEVNSDYGSGLTLIGTMSISPALDIAPMVDAMVDGTVTKDQMAIIPIMLTGVRDRHPDLVIDDYVHGPMRSGFEVFLRCTDDAQSVKGAILDAATPADVRPVDEAAADRLRRYLSESSLPKQRAGAPMFIAYSEADKLVRPQWTAQAITRACGLGDVIATTVVQDQPHGTLDLGTKPTEWIAGRLTGLTPPDTCRRQ